MTEGDSESTLLRFLGFRVEGFIGFRVYGFRV